jgi:hypothetical protein
MSEQPTMSVNPKIVADEMSKLGAIADAVRSYIQDTLGEINELGPFQGDDPNDPLAAEFNGVWGPSMQTIRSAGDVIAPGLGNASELGIDTADGYTDSDDDNTHLVTG